MAADTGSLLCSIVGWTLARPCCCFLLDDDVDDSMLSVSSPLRFLVPLRLLVESLNAAPVSEKEAEDVDDDDEEEEERLLTLETVKPFRGCSGGIGAGGLGVGVLLPGGGFCWRFASLFLLLLALPALLMLLEGDDGMVGGVR